MHPIVFKTQGAYIGWFVFLGKSSSIEHSEDAINFKHYQVQVNQEASRLIHIIRCLSKFEKIELFVFWIS
jgi:hypothetical protein